MAREWGAESSRAFFARCCPLLLEVGAIAYWSMDLREMPAGVQDTVESVTQCVLRLDKHSVRVVKAEGRHQTVKGTLLHWQSGDDGPVLSEAEVIGRVATSLRALRRSRKITQHEFAEMAGVTTSAISQAERGERGLSLSTLVRLSARLGLTLDDLLHGEDPATYRIGRRTGDPRRGPDPAITLLGGMSSDVRIDLVHLGARAAGVPMQHQRRERHRRGIDGASSRFRLTNSRRRSGRARCSSRIVRASAAGAIWATMKLFCSGSLCRARLSQASRRIGQSATRLQHCCISLTPRS